MNKLKNIKTRVFVFLKDKNKKNYFRILKEVCSLVFIKKELPLYYFAKFLYRKEIIDYKAYLSQKETRKIVNHIKPERNTHIKLIRNKLDFGNLLEINGINTAVILGFNQKNNFQIKEEKFKIYTESDLHHFLEIVLKRAKKPRLFVKPVSEQGGKDCFIINETMLEASAKGYLEKITSGAFLFQECIEQHVAINEINSDTVNSIRFNTYMDAFGNTQIISAFMRFGRNGNAVDNGSSGGFYVPVDLERGILKNEGKQLMRFGGNVFYKHPDTKFNFSNFKIPFFDEACLLIQKAAPLVPIKMLGWDIAIDEKEPILIEVNDNFSLFVADIAYGGYIKHPIIKKIIKN